jgi:hypothetical protein
MSIEEFRTPFQVKLDKENRWVRLGNSLPWDALASIYYRSMSTDMGCAGHRRQDSNRCNDNQAQTEAGRQGDH